MNRLTVKNGDEQQLKWFFFRSYNVCFSLMHINRCIVNNKLCQIVGIRHNTQGLMCSFPSQGTNIVTRLLDFFHCDESSSKSF